MKLNNCPKCEKCDKDALMIISHIPLCGDHVILWNKAVQRKEREQMEEQLKWLD